MISKRIWHKDDLTLTVRDDTSCINSMKTVCKFSDHTRLKINISKTDF